MIKFIIYVDILGFEYLPQEISEKTGVYVESIRQNYFSKPFKEAISKIKKKCIKMSEGVSEIEGSDSCILVVDTFQVICEIIDTLASIKIPHVDYGDIPFEIAIDAKDFDEVLKVELINRNEIIEFLKNDILSSYRKYYRAKNKKPIKSTFVVATEHFLNQLEPLDRTYYEGITYNRKKYFIADLKKILERSQVYKFLKEVNIEGSKLYDRINDLYIPPIEYEEICQALNKNRIVFITGTAEYGKTYTSVRLLWEYFTKGYKPKWITGREVPERIEARKIFEDIEKELKPHRIIYFEDPFGKIRYERKEDLERSIGGIIESIQCENDVFVIVTSREEVFKEFKKESLSSVQLEKFEKNLNIKKPSYNYGKRKKILISWAKLKDCEWLGNSHLKNSVLEYLKNDKYLPTPLSIKQFVISSSHITELNKLKEKIEEKSEDTTETFAKEVENMSSDKVLFLSFPFIFDFKITFVKKLFNELVEELNIRTSGFDEILEWFKEDKIDIRGKKIKFTHPSYLESKRYLLSKRGKPTEINIKIFSKVLEKISEKGEREKLVIIMEIIEEFDILTVKSHELLKTLVKDEKGGTCAAMRIVSMLDKCSSELGKLLFRLLRNKDIAAFVVTFISEWSKRLSSEAVNLQLKLLKREEVTIRVVRFFITRYEEVSDDSKQLLLRLLKGEHIAQVASMFWMKNLDKLDDKLKNILFSSFKNEKVAQFASLYLLTKFNDLTKEERLILSNLLRRKKIVGKVARILLTEIGLFPNEVEVKILDRLLERRGVVIYLLVDLIISFEKLPKKSKNALIKQIEKETFPNYMLFEISKKMKKELPTKIKLSPNKIKRQIKEGYKHLLKVRKLKRVETKDLRALASLG